MPTGTTAEAGAGLPRAHPQTAGATEAGDAAWVGLFRVGGIAALIAALVFRRNLGTEYMLLRASGVTNVGPSTPPITVMEWFTVLQSSKLLGLTLLNVFDMVNYALVGLLLLALLVALRGVSRAAVTIATAFGFVGIAVYFASNQAFAMLSLSNQYASATTDGQRSMLVAAGQAMLAVHGNASYEGTGMYISFLLVSVAGLMMAVAMLRGSAFSKATAYVGILANVFGLSYYMVLAFAPAIVALPLSVSALFLLAWYVLSGIGLLRLASRLSAIQRSASLR